MRFTVAAPVALALTLVAVGAAAQVTQPDGTVVPIGGLLQSTFDARGEGIDAVADAATTPETFIPGCALTFEVLIRNAGYRNSFGWYNATGVQPTVAELFEFLTCTDDVGTSRVLDIRQDPRWTGGEVGFYQATGSCATLQDFDNLFFSEKGYNPDGSEQNPYVHLLIYNSNVIPQAFYFGWEDLLTNNDNDFDDLTTFVTGITCSGGGEPCTVQGASGICAQGTIQCQAGVLTCVGYIEPQTEACDGFDNDCNGQIDEGDLCQAGYICDRGNCVPACDSGEFECPPELVCDQAVCIDPDCVGVSCSEGERCVDGECRGPCENVVCPHDEVCLLGVCLDPCGAAVCDAAQVCEGGVCVDKCQCKGCDAGDLCQESGHCVEAACDSIPCDPGTHCEAGACVDDCAGATCPEGQVCQGGDCVDGGGEGGGPSGTGAGVTIGVGGEGSGSGGGPSGPGQGGDGGGSSSGDPAAGGSSSDGCGCEVPGRRVGATPAVALALALGCSIVARRRRRHG